MRERTILSISIRTGLRSHERGLSWIETELNPGQTARVNAALVKVDWLPVQKRLPNIIPFVCLDRILLMCIAPVRRSMRLGPVTAGQAP